MFYRLKSCYALRGWEGMAWVLIRRPENRRKVLTKEQFQVLTLCDGETEWDPALLDDTLQKALTECEKEGYIEPSTEARPLDDDQYYRYYHNRYD